MTRVEQVKICRKCQNREMDTNRGLICKLTGDVATFEGQCPDFVQDENVRDQIDLEDAESTANLAEKLLSSEVWQKVLDEQDLKKGILFGFLSGIIGAGVWGFITVLTGYQIGYMAIGMGFLVGFTIRFFGNGVKPVFGYWGAGISLLSCVLGNFFSIVGYIADYEKLGFFETLMLIDYSLMPEIMAETFSPMDLLFYGLALWFGYKYSSRVFTEEDLQDMMVSAKTRS
jgi:hypothetical protein